MAEFSCRGRIAIGPLSLAEARCRLDVDLKILLSGSCLLRMIPDSGTARIGIDSTRQRWIDVVFDVCPSSLLSWIDRIEEYRNISSVCTWNL